MSNDQVWKIISFFLTNWLKFFSILYPDSVGSLHLGYQWETTTMTQCQAFRRCFATDCLPDHQCAAPPLTRHHGYHVDFALLKRRRQPVAPVRLRHLLQHEKIEWEVLAPFQGPGEVRHGHDARGHHATQDGRHERLDPRTFRFQVGKAFVNGRDGLKRSITTNDGGLAGNRTRNVRLSKRDRNRARGHERQVTSRTWPSVKWLSSFKLARAEQIESLSASLTSSDWRMIISQAVAMCLSTFEVVKRTRLA